MRWLTEDAVLVCDHRGRVDIQPTQTLVRVETRRVLVEDNPQGRGISRCPNVNPAAGIRACATTLRVREGYSEFIRIQGRPVCLDTVIGLTDGSPPGTVNYLVTDPGQRLVGQR